MKKILVTGAAGYIGSHVCLGLAEAGYEPVALVDPSQPSQTGVLQRLQALIQRPLVHESVDLENVKAIREVLERHTPDAVVHLAGDDLFRSTGGIISRRLLLRLREKHYWSGFCLVQAMEATGLRQLVCASSDTVYSPPLSGRLHETTALTQSHPIGIAHKEQEDLLEAIQKADARWKVGVLRLFEVVGAHESMELGPTLSSSPTNWLMELAHVAAGLLPHARVSGCNHPSPDGSPVRDYVHVSDVSDCVIDALRAIETYAEGFVVNVGTGFGTSKVAALEAFESACRCYLRYHYTNGRPFDASTSVADPSLANQLLGWRARRDLTRMCQDTWNWHQRYLPSGNPPQGNSLPGQGMTASSVAS